MVTYLGLGKLEIPDLNQIFYVLYKVGKPNSRHIE